MIKFLGLIFIFTLLTGCYLRERTIWDNSADKIYGQDNEFSQGTIYKFK